MLRRIGNWLLIWKGPVFTFAAMMVMPFAIVLFSAPATPKTGVEPLPWEFVDKVELVLNQLQEQGYAIIQERTSTGEYQMVIVLAIHEKDGRTRYQIIPILAP